MGIINILDAQTANMIAAGEVVDRPASALKELLENALDAGATKIFVDIKGGGRVFLRVTDNGTGFFRDDMPKALLRHATSKIATGEDLTAIGTFGFRGEALAAIGSVSRMEIISRQRSETVGTRLTSDENGIVMEDTGCPEGTSVVVRDLFYNTPARQKFLKRDATEASACVTAAEHAALSHPEVSFTVSVDGERRFYTAGDGKLLTAVHTIYGKDFSSGLLPVEETMDGVHVFGYVTSPDHARGSRAMQLFFVNGRPVRSRTILAALEEAFKSFLPHGRYPGAVLFVELPLRLTDVNVHPAKLEIRFADERVIFSAVYYTVRNRLSESPTAEEQPEQTPGRESEAADPAAEKGEKTPAEEEKPERPSSGTGLKPQEL
ncbi:MAG: DNA mismatch repair endonuclease MutL, partial [Clostridia bacterium]|nr:DNA mismatch repair endonuclease MutL [Clostridia bacterium]